MTKKRNIQDLLEIHDIIGTISHNTAVAIKDAVIGNDNVLLEIDATHSGNITGNGKFYSPRRMRDGAESFVKPYHAPMIVHHDIYSADPIGRIRKAEYVDFSKDYKDPEINKLVQKMFRVKNDELHNQTLKELYGHLDKQGYIADYGNNYKGLGTVRIFVEILDPEAVEKVVDGRYDTVSVGFMTDRFVCMECGNYLMSEQCEHDPWDDGVVISPHSHRYYETSFVNLPADVLGKINRDSNMSSPVQHLLADSLQLSSGIIVLKPTHDEVEDMKKDKNGNPITEPVVDELETEQELDTDGRELDNTNESDDLENSETDGDDSSQQEDEGESGEEDSSEQELETDTQDSEENEAEIIKPSLFTILSKDKYIVALNKYIADLEQKDAEAFEKYKALVIAEDTIESIDTASCVGPEGSFVVLDKGHIEIGLSLLDQFEGPYKNKIADKLKAKAKEFDTETEDQPEGVAITVDSVGQITDKAIKQEIFNALYSECADSHKEIQALKTENIMLKFESTASTVETADTQALYDELVSKVKPIIVDTICKVEVELAKLDKDQIDTRKETLKNLDFKELMNKFDILNDLGDNNTEEDSDAEDLSANTDGDEGAEAEESVVDNNSNLQTGVKKESDSEIMINQLRSKVGSTEAVRIVNLLAQLKR